MFRASETEPQMSLFDNPSDMMCKRAAKKYEDPKAWQNQFYRMVTSEIDESLFQPLFKEGRMGAPNASIRRLVAMSVLKEGFGCSDEELMEKCDYDLLTRRALGLLKMEDACPSLDTYYLFRRRICDYADETGENLMERCFERLTAFQASKFKIQGKAVRMDSKLIGSNIAWYPRYELIHKTFLQEMPHYMALLNPSLRKRVQPWLDEDAKQTVYRSNAEKIQARLSELGGVIYRVLVRVKAQDGLLKRVFEEQYEVEHGVVTPRDRKSISADSVQNPNDPDAEYRRKGDQQVKGYSVNVTETTDEEGKPSLVTAVQVSGVTASDSGFFEEAVAKSESVTGGSVEKVYSDGAYQSAENRSLPCDGVFTGMQNRASRFRIERDAEGGAKVTDTETGVIYEAVRTGGGSLRIPNPDGGSSRWRYFPPGQQESMLFRQHLDNLPQSERNKRNNVEATIFQLCFHSRNNKTRYRGQRKHELWALARCMWINLRRIVIFEGKTTPKLSGNTFSGVLAALSRLLDCVGTFFSASEIRFQLRTIRPVWITCSQKGVF